MSLAPKVLWPSSWLAVAQTKPSNFSVNPVLFNPYWLTMIVELYLHSYANEPNKSPWRERIKALLHWEIGHLSSPSRSPLGSLFLHPWWTGGAVLKPPDTTWLLAYIVFFMLMSLSGFSTRVICLIKSVCKYSLLLNFWKNLRIIDINYLNIS